MYVYGKYRKWTHTTSNARKQKNVRIYSPVYTCYVVYFTASLMGRSAWGQGLGPWGWSAWSPTLKLQHQNAVLVHKLTNHLCSFENIHLPRQSGEKWAIFGLVPHPISWHMRYLALYIKILWIGSNRMSKWRPKFSRIRPKFVQNMRKKIASEAVKKTT